MAELSEEELQELYAWIDEIPLSRQKKNITRDFSDGVLAAEVVYHFLPKLVELHNYTPANAVQQKVDNWRTLNRKVCSKLNFGIPEDLLQGAANGKPGVIEFILSILRNKIENYLQNKIPSNNSFPLENSFPALSGENTVHPEQMVAEHIARGLPWMASPSQEMRPHESLKQQNRTYPGPSGPSHSKHSRIPLPSQRKQAPPNSPQSAPSTMLPPIASRNQDSKPTMLPPSSQNKWLSKYAGNGRINQSSTNKSSRETSAGMRIRLAEKDQKLLETQEYIQYLQMKLTRYEHLVQIKDMKITELKKEIETLQASRRQSTYQHHPYYQKR